jgi:hypothetical protein
MSTTILFGKHIHVIQKVKNNKQYLIPCIMEIFKVTVAPSLKIYIVVKCKKRPKGLIGHLSIMQQKMH